jgi:hypothetical protein
MPVDPSTVEITCLDQGSTATSLTLISAPHAGITSAATNDGHGLLSVQINPADPPAPPVELFTEKGTRVHGTISPLGVVSFRAPAGASSVTILAMEQLGENAGARQTKRVQAWTIVLAPSSNPTPSPTPTPTPRTTSGGTGSGLAPSGGRGDLVPAGLLLVILGAAMAVKARP